MSDAVDPVLLLPPQPGSDTTPANVAKSCSVVRLPALGDVGLMESGVKRFMVNLGVSLRPCGEHQACGSQTALASIGRRMLSLEGHRVAICCTRAARSARPERPTLLECFVAAVHTAPRTQGGQRVQGTFGFTGAFLTKCVGGRIRPSPGKGLNKVIRIAA